MASEEAARRPPERLRLLLTPDENAPAAARRALRRMPLGERREDVLLLASELVTSAVVGGAHDAGDPIALDAECDGVHSRVEVRNRMGRLARPVGHSRRILDAVTDDWGVADGDEPGVWFELS